MSATSKTSTRHFYPRSPCGERRKFGFTHTAQELFLSTLSLRRATPHIKIMGAPVDNFYPRSPCGERPGDGLAVVDVLPISIHALLAESDALVPHQQKCRDRFLSTLSLRRATPSIGSLLFSSIFLSTLSLRRATEYWVGGYGTANNFYPRSPCGERPRGWPV